MPIGQAGSITTNSPGENTPITVTFDQPLDNPIIALTATNNGGNQFVLRVIDVTDTSFTFIIEEWEYHDGPHPAVETINWLAVEEGVHTLPDGRIIEAGTSSVDSSGSSASLSGGFTNPPVVLTSVMSENDTTTVDSDPLNITASGFDLTLQEEELEDNDHAAETVGWIAIQAGGTAGSGTAQSVGGVDENTDTIALGDTFNNAVVLAETQTINGSDTATVVIDGQSNSSVGLFIEEEASQDTELNHINETVGVVAFEDGLIPCFTAGTRITTQRGEMDVSALRAGDLVFTRDAGFQPIRWICNSTMSTERLLREPDLAPITVKKDAFGPGLPMQDMQVSPQHRFLLRGWQVQLQYATSEVLVPARGLLDGRRACAVAPADPVTYIHLLLDDHQILYANGTPTESLHAGQFAKSGIDPQARAELLRIFPDLRCFERNFGPMARQTLSVLETRGLVA
ncbi:MAG: Hint domain-containing protein [Pelagimonas sp.]|jgi:hypothetical protein|nr:Hint domain-containing protein [Pelagimonas sp.]